MTDVQFELPIDLMPSAEFMASVPTYDTDKDYLGPFFHGGYRITVAGPQKHGKTSFLMEASAATARGDNFIGFKGAGVPVAFLDLEMGKERLAQAMGDARLPHENFHAISRPEGLKIDERKEDWQLIHALCAHHRVVVIDPWHKVVAQELGESKMVGRIVRFLDGLRERFPDCCVVIGFHAQEPQTPRSEINLGSISGFKAFQRGADVVLTIQRVATNTTRIMWVADRSPTLGVGFKEKWQLEWERGSGFRRTDVKSNPEEVYALLTDEWQSTTMLAVRWGRDRSQASKSLARLAMDGRVESQGSDKGGRGQEKFWRLVNPDQEVLEVAA